VEDSSSSLLGRPRSGLRSTPHIMHSTAWSGTGSPQWGQRSSASSLLRLRPNSRIGPPRRLSEQPTRGSNALRAGSERTNVSAARRWRSARCPCGKVSDRSDAGSRSPPPPGVSSLPDAMVGQASTLAYGYCYVLALLQAAHPTGIPAPQDYAPGARNGGLGTPRPTRYVVALPTAECVVIPIGRASSSAKLGRCGPSDHTRRAHPRVGASGSSATVRSA
jgi:hypothetical protein